MSWLFSQALVAEYLADISSDGELSALSSGSPIQQAYCAPDKMTAFFRLSRFGMTFKPLTEDRGEELLTSYLAGFPARTSPSQGKEMDSTESVVECGWRWPASFAKYDRVTSSWRTRQCSLIADSTEFSETWPAWGSMLDGECLELTPLVRPSTESESGFWQTPTTRDSKGQSGKGNRIRRGKGGRLHVANLCDQIVDCGRPDLVRSIQFRYSLMGWPQGWTDLRPLETDKFQQWQQLHGNT